MTNQTIIDGLVELHTGLNSIIGKNDMDHYLAVVNYDYNIVDIEARKIASRIIREQFAKNPETYYRSELVANPIEAEIQTMRKALSTQNS